MSTRTLIRKSLRFFPWIRKVIYLIFNRIIFNINGVEVGKNARLFNRMYLTIAKYGSLRIGNNFTLISGDGINPLCRNIRAEIFVDKGASISIGNNTGMSSPCLRAKKSITIGNNVLIGADTIITDTDGHSLNWKIRNGSVKNSNNLRTQIGSIISKPIIIEDDVFIGTRCIILKGVTIGTRSIIAAGSVVTKSIPSDCIAGGNPCKVIKFINHDN